MRRTDPESSNRSYFRTQDRVFAQNGQWYFASREGEIGPFVTREAAIREVARYAQERCDLDRFQQAREVRQLHAEKPSLSIVPKEAGMSLDELILENQS